MTGILDAPLLHSVLEHLSLPVLLICKGRALYCNPAATRLSLRLKADHGTDLFVLVSDHVEAVAPHLARGAVVSLVTAANGEPFYVHASQLSCQTNDVVLITVRELAPDRDAFKSRYRLSDREAEVVNLVLRGYANRDIAAAMGITPATTKKHLGSIFNKVGVDSRTQLMSKIA